VQIATQPAALLFTRRYEAFPCPLELGIQADRVRRHARLARQTVEQLAIRAAEAFARCARVQQQCPDMLTLVDQRQASSRAVRTTNCSYLQVRTVAISQGDRGIRQPESLGDGLHDRRQHRLRRQRVVEPLPETHQDTVGIIPLAVQQAIDPRLDPHAHRLKKRGDQPGGNQRRDQVRP
jgi:hypothetical protein